MAGVIRFCGRGRQRDSRQRPARSKYGNHPTVIDGVRFASRRESDRYAQLRLLERSGEIAGLQLQPAFALAVAGVHITTYVADFTYVDLRDGSRVIEDAKGARTRLYRLKKKLMAAIHGITVREV